MVCGRLQAVDKTPPSFEYLLADSSMRFIRKLPLVFVLYKQTALWVGNALRYCAGFLFLPAGQLFPGCVIPALLGRGRRIIVVVERLLPMRFSVRVDFLHQLFRIVFGCCRDLLLHLLLRVGVGFDVGAVYKAGSRRKISRICYFAQDPCKYLVYRFRSKAVPEVIAYRREMRRFFL